MTLDFIITAAKTMKEYAEHAEQTGAISQAISNYRIAAKKYQQAAAADRANSGMWQVEAGNCLSKAKKLEDNPPEPQPADTSNFTGGSSNGSSGRSGSDGSNKSAGAAGGKKSAGKTTSNGVAKNDGNKKKPTVEEALGKLNELVGLGKVKSQINAWVDQLKVFKMREANGLPVPDMSYHMVFTGNPGTGKTTVARIVADIYCALGILSEGQLVEVERSKLVAGYVGQTAIKTQEIIDKAIGGVLFIDEAYTLSPSNSGSNDFGQEAIDTILKGMEDHRDDLVVVVAGYDNLMAQFIDSNPGLKSRFKTYIKFDDYTGREMYSIFTNLCAKNKYVLADGVDKQLYAYFNDVYAHRGKNFGNARDVRNMFEKMVTNQSARIAQLRNPTYNDMVTVKGEDLPIT